MSRAYTKPVEGALKAELDYRVLGSSDNYHLLEVQLHTGRHHQIRCQLAAIGCPVKGDVKYGFNRTNEGGFIHLHSYRLKFVHPIKQEEVIIKAFPISTDAVWNFFKNIPDL